MATPFFSSDEKLDAFDGGKLDVHVEGDAMLGEKLDDALAVGRLDDVSDEGFFAEGFDVDVTALGEFVAGPDDEDEGIAVELDGGEFALFGEIGDDADVELVIEKLAGHVAREDAVNADVDAGIEGAESIESREQGVDGAFVDADGDLAALKARSSWRPLRISSRRLSIRFAYSRSSTPASVRVLAPAPGTKRGWPTHSSSLRMAMLMAGWVRNSFSAARE